MGRVLTLLSLLVLTGGVWGQPATFTVHTEPQGAALKDQYQQYLGRSGEPIRKDLGDYGTKLELSIQLDGYSPERVIVLVKSLTREGRYPSTGVLALRPNSLATWLKSRPDVLAGLGLTGLAGLAAALWAFQRLRTLRTLQHRMASLKRYESGQVTDSLILKTLGSYRLLELLGRGGNAAVYRAVPDVSLDEKEAVAFKVLRFGPVDDPDFFKRFQRECQISRSMNHRGVVRLLDFGEEQGLHYIVLELVPGGSLRTRVRPGGLPLAEVFELLAPVFEGVAYAHAMGIVHRDLKPENVLVTPDGRCKVTDFGLARAEDSEKVTRTGMTLGTPAYMSPEQINGTVDYRTDQYSLGVVFHELLVGECPFEDPDPVRLIFKHLTEEPPALDELRPDVGRPLAEVVRKMLAKEPNDRYPTLIEAWQALVACA